MQNGWGCGPVLDGCTFAANACVSGEGGAVYNNFNSSLTVISCSFNDNTSKLDGGAMYIRDDTEGAVTVSLTSFCGNSPQDISGVWEDNGGNVFDDACPQGCPADFNDDGIVDGADLTILLANWGLTCESCGPDCPADLVSRRSGRGVRP